MSSSLVRSSVEPPDSEIGAELVARLRASDVKAFETLFHAYYAHLVNVAYRHVGSEDHAEEIVQDVFVRLWEGREHWVLRTSIRAYLYCVVRNAALNAIRHKRVAAQYANGLTGRGSTGAMGTWDNAADAPLMANETAAVLLRAICALPARAQHAYRLRLDHLLSYAEIGEVMGITPKAVQKLITRADLSLDEALRAYLDSILDRRRGLAKKRMGVMGTLGLLKCSL